MSNPPPNLVKLQYIGACALLARLSSQIHNEEDLDSIATALEDCAKLWPDSLEVVGGTSGYSLEVKP